MIEWRDDAILLGVRPHGETALVATIFARLHGRHAGLVHGRSAPAQPGSLVAARWRARLADHLGRFAIEPVDQPAGRLIDRPLPLMALGAVCALLDAAMAEREAHPALWDGTAALLSLLDGEAWDAALVRWEVGLLAELGFGLDLSSCALGGDNDHLAYVSPRSGRAVSAAAGEPWRDRLLPLPGFLVGAGPADATAILDGLALTGHFLERHLLAQGWRALPAARTRLVEAYRREAAASDSVPPT